MLPGIRNLRYVKIAALLVALSFVVGACGGSEPTPTATVSPPTISTVAVPATTGATATPLETATPSPSEPTRLGEDGPYLSTPDIIQLLSPSVVHIQTEAVQLDFLNRPVPSGGVGTGEIIDEKGHILTNNHVVEGAERILVTLSDGRAFEAELVGRDPSTDLAVVRIDAKDLVPIAIGQSSDLRVGDPVIAMGQALDLPGGPTVTGGLVSALDREIPVSETITIRNLIQTDAAINPGNSGGPLVNQRGEMVGINTAKIQTGEGIGFAIAIDSAKPLIAELIEKGRVERGFLGVSAVNITEALALNNDLPVSDGVGIVSVAPGSPAEDAGLMPLDIIVGMSGREIGNLTDLGEVLIGYKEGSRVDVEFYREDVKMVVTVILGERPT